MLIISISRGGGPGLSLPETGQEADPIGNADERIRTSYLKKRFSVSCYFVVVCSRGIFVTLEINFGKSKNHCF